MNIALQHQGFALADAITAPFEESKSWPLQRAYEYCERLARAHYENFPVGSVLIPKLLRKHFYSIYAFARTADDFADEGYEQGIPENERLDLLVQWLEMLRESFNGRASHPVFVALANTIREFDLPRQLFEDLLSAFSQDVMVRRYESFEQLIDYCRRSANPIGRLILLLFGYVDDERHRWSDHICTALQLTNHWQDVAIDIRKDRIYLPQEDLSRFDLVDSDLKAGVTKPQLKDLIQFEIARTGEMFSNGKPLCTSVHGRLGLELRAVWLGGMRILDLIQKNGYDVLGNRPVIALSDKLMILLRASSSAAFRLY